MIRVVVLCVVCVFCGVPAAAAGEPWQSEVALYGWFAGLEGTIGVADRASLPVDAEFDDLLGHLDFAVAGRFEAWNATSVLMADVSYTGLGGTRDARIGGQTVPVDGDLDQWIVEAAYGRRLSPEFTAIVAGRLYVIDTGATFPEALDIDAAGVSTSWADVFVGARWARPLGDRWTAALRGDVGAGGSDFAWFGQATLGCRISPRVTVGAAWRWLGLDREADAGSAEYFRYDVTQSGLGLGVAYGF